MNSRIIVVAVCLCTAFVVLREPANDEDVVCRSLTLMDRNGEVYLRIHGERGDARLCFFDNDGEALVEIGVRPVDSWNLSEPVGEDFPCVPFLLLDMPKKQWPLLSAWSPDARVSVVRMGNRAAFTTRATKDRVEVYVGDEKSRLAVRAEVSGEEDGPDIEAYSIRNGKAGFRFLSTAKGFDYQWF